jgi:ABC-type uncharacterized transport system permease subunit
MEFLDFLGGVLTSSNYWFIVLRSTAPILLVTLGAVVCEKAGISNMALEGSLLWAALVGVIVSAWTQNVWIGVAAGILASTMVAWTLGLFALKLEANAVLVGVALNLVSTGGTVFVLHSLTGDKGISSSLDSKTLPFLTIPGLHDVPWLGTVLSGQNLVVYLAVAAVVVVGVLLKQTVLGRRITAVGSNPEAARSMGISVVRTKMFALTVSGILAGLAGCFLSMGYTSNFTSGLSAGRGYVANAAQVVAGGTATGSIFASLLFGLADALATFLQNIGLPPELIQALPYAVTIVGFVVVTLLRDRQELARKRALAKAAA